MPSRRPFLVPAVPRLVYLLVIVGSLGVAASANAACNAIPSADVVSATMAGRTEPAETALAHLGFKGALGRVDRVYLVPGTADTVVFVPDGICVGTDGPHTVAPPRLEKAEDLVALVYFRIDDGTRPAVRVFASSTTCASLVPPLRQQLADEHAALDVLPTCSGGIDVGTAPERVIVPLLEPSELATAFRDTGRSTAVRILVGPKAIIDATLVQRAGNRPCRELCGGLADQGAVACIDDIFTRATTASGKSEYIPDPIPCQEQMGPVDANDFAQRCENEDATPPPCRPPASLPDLRMWQDSCGAMHVPFDWRAIRPASGAPRVVRGRTGIGRKNSTTDTRIEVPGREFLGSTPVKNPNGDFSHWRRPLVEPWEDPASPEEFGLQGTADKDNSIVHVFARVPVRAVCADVDPKKACLGVSQGTDGGEPFCACHDHGGTGPCACDDLGTARYFACSGEKYRGRPCTRDLHCGGGRCDAKPRCRDLGAVWTQPDDSGDECTVDGECPGTKQCGYSLFNLDNAIEGTVRAGRTGGRKTGVVVLDAKITTGGSRRRRGVCTKKPTATCRNGDHPAGCPDGDCRGYQLIAGPTK